MQHWVSWAGYPTEVITDRGLHNRGVFARELAAAGVYCASIGLEAPYQLGKVERRGATWKTGAAKVIESRSISGIRAMAAMASEVTYIVNEKNCTGGFSARTWTITTLQCR